MAFFVQLVTFKFSYFEYKASIWKPLCCIDRRLWRLRRGQRRPRRFQRQRLEMTRDQTKQRASTSVLLRARPNEVQMLPRCPQAQQSPQAIQRKAPQLRKVPYTRFWKSQVQPPLWAMTSLHWRSLSGLPLAFGLLKFDCWSLIWCAWLLLGYIFLNVFCIFCWFTAYRGFCMMSFHRIPLHKAYSTGWHASAKQGGSAEQKRLAGQKARRDRLEKFRAEGNELAMRYKLS